MEGLIQSVTEKTRIYPNRANIAITPVVDHLQSPRS
jgi:hypothetical protein